MINKIRFILVMILVLFVQGMKSEIANGPTFGSVQAIIDLPVEDHVQNSEGTDGSGLCVFAALQMAASWEAIPELEGLFTYMKTQKGGGWPDRVKRILEMRAPHLAWVQKEGDTTAMLDRAMATGRPACVTYGYGEWYRDKNIELDANGLPKIDHMVFLAHLDQDYAAIIDSNDSKFWTWMTRKEFLKRHRYPSGKGWAIVLLAPPPPPRPMN